MRLISFFLTVNQTEVLMYLPEHLVHQLDQGGLLHQFDPEKLMKKIVKLIYSSLHLQLRSIQTKEISKLERFKVVNAKVIETHMVGKYDN